MEKFERDAGLNPIIGSAHETASEMFDAHERADEDVRMLASKREERGIFEDVEGRFERALEREGYEQVLELPNGVRYPTITEWIAHRIERARGTRYYPCFVRKGDTVFFCKAQIRKGDDSARGMRQEFDAMTSLPQGIRAPKPVAFVEGDEDSVSLFISEAIPMSEASIMPAAKWTIDHARDVARQIGLVESVRLPEGEEAGVDREVAEASTLLAEAGELVDADLAVGAESIIAAFKAVGRRVNVHGDLATKNVLVGDAGAYLVDWEMSGPSFQGRDIAKLWSGLSENPDAQLELLSSYTAGDEARTLGVAFGIIYENLVHLAWRNRDIVQKGRRDSYPDLDREVRGFNDRIRSIIMMMKAA